MNYATGRQNAITTANALQGMSNSYNPLGYGNAASSANSSAFSEADTINQQNIAKAQAIASTVESGIGMAATGGIGGLAGGAGMGGGLGGFLKAGANSLGANFQAPQAMMSSPTNMATQNLPQMPNSSANGIVMASAIQQLRTTISDKVKHVNRSITSTRPS